MKFKLGDIVKYTRRGHVEKQGKIISISTASIHTFCRVKFPKGRYWVNEDRLEKVKEGLL